MAAFRARGSVVAHVAATVLTQRGNVPRALYTCHLADTIAHAGEQAAITPHWSASCGRVTQMRYHECMRHFVLYAAGIIILIVIGVLAFSQYAGKAPQPPAIVSYDAQLAACHAYPNGSTQQVTETSRLTIYLPKALYPNQNGLLSFTTASGTAKAGWVSNAGLPGSSYGATADCFATYYDFEGSGVVDLVATSSVPSMPEYVVHFSVESAGATTPPGNSGEGAVSGTVLLGPTCPVEHIPPYPQCADKPYQTTITVYKGTDTSTIKSVQSGADGSFTLALPPGSYTLKAGGASFYPRCAPAQVSVVTGKTATTTISCDTGIR